MTERWMTSHGSRAPLVLSIDDDNVNQVLIESLLTRAGLQVKAALSGHQALTLLDGGLRPDIILLDVIMPEMDGYEVCRMIRSMQAMASVPIIMISSLTSVADKAKGFQELCDDYLTKPLDKDELITRVWNHFRLSQAHASPPSVDPVPSADSLTGRPLNTPCQNTVVSPGHSIIPLTAFADAAALTAALRRLHQAQCQVAALTSSSLIVKGDAATVATAAGVAVEAVNDTTTVESIGDSQRVVTATRVASLREQATTVVKAEVVGNMLELLASEAAAVEPSGTADALKTPGTRKELGVYVGWLAETLLNAKRRVLAETDLKMLPQLFVRATGNVHTQQLEREIKEAEKRRQNIHTLISWYKEINDSDAAMEELSKAKQKVEKLHDEVKEAKNAMTQAEMKTSELIGKLIVAKNRRNAVENIRTRVLSQLGM